jgi:hypothetical protein
MVDVEEIKTVAASLRGQLRLHIKPLTSKYIGKRLLVTGALESVSDLYGGRLVLMVRLKVDQELGVSGVIYPWGGSGKLVSLPGGALVAIGARIDTIAYNEMRLTNCHAVDVRLAQIETQRF